MGLIGRVVKDAVFIGAAYVAGKAVYEHCKEKDVWKDFPITDVFNDWAAKDKEDTAKASN